jgi:hypothetical protein
MPENAGVFSLINAVGRDNAIRCLSELEMLAV